MAEKQPLLVTFAVNEEAAPFRRVVGNQPDVQIIVTGMGPGNARRSVESALDTLNPAWVMTCGFAGGLNPNLPPMTIVFDADETCPWVPAKLPSAGGQQATFLCSTSVLATVEAKRAAFRQSNADAVEMESGIIRSICRERGVPSATVRVISDAADEPLPLDFSALMTSDYQMDFFKLAAALLRSPRRIPDLMRFRRRILKSADRLADTLSELIR